MKFVIKENKKTIKFDELYVSKTVRDALSQDDRANFIKLIKILEKK